MVRCPGDNITFILFSTIEEDVEDGEKEHHQSVAIEFGAAL